MNLPCMTGELLLYRIVRFISLLVRAPAHTVSSLDRSVVGVVESVGVLGSQEAAQTAGPQCLAREQWGRLENHASASAQQAAGPQGPVQTGPLAPPLYAGAPQAGRLDEAVPLRAGRLRHPWPTLLGQAVALLPPLQGVTSRDGVSRKYIRFAAAH